MKIISFILAVTVLVLSNNFNSLSQISQGGKPISLSGNLLKSSRKMPVVKMPVFDIANEKKTHENSKCEVFAKKINVEIDIKKSGILQTIANSGNLWLLEIKSEGAYSLNIIFSRYRLSKGSRLFIYSADGQQVIGAFTEQNNNDNQILATELIKGDDIVIELFEPLNPEFESELVIESVNHDYTNIQFEDGNFGIAANCCVDVNCTAGANWQIEKQAVCLMIIAGTIRCSGALINNINNDGTPYFLTANHCYTDGKDIDSYEYLNLVRKTVFYFNYESSTCGGINGDTLKTMSGANLRAHWADSDFCLLELSPKIPPSYNPYYAGWYVGNTATSTPSVMIHHPKGAVKKISVKNSAPTTDVNPKLWRIYQWDIGETQGGSSGAPLFNSDHRIIGQHRGASTLPACSSGKIYQMGKLFYSWSGGGTDATRLSTWLAKSTPKNFMHGLRNVINYYGNAVIDSNTAVSGDYVRFTDVEIQDGSSIKVKYKDGFEAVRYLNVPVGCTFEITP